jgi:hypothetical protein
MHDELTERRLRSALREAGDGLSFTITAAELERRMALRGRRSGNTRLTLLLAAAVAIGALGAGAIIAGLANKPAPSPVAEATATSAATAGAPMLPTLDALMAAETGTVLVAQAFGPADGPGDPLPSVIQLPIPTVALGDISGGGDYDVSVACLGQVPLQVALVAANGSSQAIDGPRFECDGSVRTRVIRIAGPASAFITYRDPASWRVVVRGQLRQPPLPTANPVLPPVAAGLEELIRVDDGTVESGAPEWGLGLQLTHLGAVSARLTFASELWCEPGARLELLFADDTGGMLNPAIETEIACDGLVHALLLPLPLPNGSPVYVAAAATTRWSVVVTSPTPPVKMATDVPGWQLAGGFGPSLQFETTEVSFSDTVGDHGGPLMVVVECAGDTQDIDVSVDAKGILGDAFQHHVATCTPDGTRTSFTLDTPSTGYLVRHEAPAGTWTALSLLTPVAPPTP